MHLIRKSKTSFIEYAPLESQIFFNTKDADGVYAQSNKCNWSADKFYVAENFEIVDANISFDSEKLTNFARKLTSINPVERGVIFQCGNQESILEAYLFGLTELDFNYSYDNILLEFNLLEMQTKNLIEAINDGRWEKLKLTVFFDELNLLHSLRQAEKSDFNNFSFSIEDFLITC